MPSYIDFHCHPSLKPFGKSFKYKPPKQNNLNSGRKNSIWHYSPPNFLERQVSKILTLTKFTQTDFTSLAKADCDIAVISLYPFEKHFLKKRILGFKFIADLLVNLASGISQKRIDYIRSHNSYYQDLIDEYSYYLQLNNFAQKINGVNYTYRLVSNYQDIRNNRLESSDTRKVISIVISIEGAHAFETGLDKDKDTAIEAKVLSHINTVKQWQHRPLFVTLSHHYYNEICGHARSINIRLIKKTQNRGLNTGITDLGYKIIRRLLDNAGSNRILIDIKHMSTASRALYYKLLETEYTLTKVPIIVSHGALNGRRSITENKISDSKMSKNFRKDDINFYDSEILKIARSKGIFGIQLDERRIGSRSAIAKSRIYWPNKKRRLKRKSLLIWRQIEHAALILNSNNIFCWEVMAIGSDFDGIINPMKGLWTSENMKDVKRHLISHADNFLKKHSDQLIVINKISAEEIIDRVLFINAERFLEANYL